MKNAILTSERKWTRKLSEIILAIVLEKQMSKWDILNRYLKKVMLWESNCTTLTQSYDSLYPSFQSLDSRFLSKFQRRFLQHSIAFRISFSHPFLQNVLVDLLGPRCLRHRRSLCPILRQTSLSPQFRRMCHARWHHSGPRAAISVSRPEQVSLNLCCVISLYMPPKNGTISFFQHKLSWSNFHESFQSDRLNNN